MMTALLVLLCAFFCVNNGKLSGNPNLKWMSFYGFDPDNQNGWSYGLSFSIYDIKEAYAKYQMPSMLNLPQADGNVTVCETQASRYPIFYWDKTQNWRTQANVCPNWSSNLKHILSEYQPFVNNGTIVGYFIGDELCCHGVAFKDFTAIVNQVRDTVGNKITIYANECKSTFQPNNPFTWTTMPEALNWISADVYDMENGTNEYVQDRLIYEQGVFPLLNQNTKYGYDQGTILVPGTFACNESAKEIEINSQQIVIALNDMYSWAKNEDRIHGFNPWHWNNLTNKGSEYQYGYGEPIGCTAGTDDLSPGAIAMPDVVAKLKEIGEAIVG